MNSESDICRKENIFLENIETPIEKPKVKPKIDYKNPKYYITKNFINNYSFNFKLSYLELEILFINFERGRITYDDLLNTFLFFLESENNDISSNIKLNITQNLLKKSKKHTSLTYCDLLVKNLLNISNNTNNKISDDNLEETIINNITKMRNFLVKYLYKTKIELIALIRNLQALTFDSYSAIVSNDSGSITLNTLYDENNIETIFAYLILFNFDLNSKDLKSSISSSTQEENKKEEKKENKKPQNENEIDFEKLNNTYKWYLVDSSLGFFNYVVRYINKQCDYFKILNKTSCIYAHQYSIIKNYENKFKSFKNAINFWLPKLNLVLEPSENDHWRIYYNYMISKNKYCFYSSKQIKSFPKITSKFFKNKNKIKIVNNINVYKSRETTENLIECLIYFKKLNYTNQDKLETSFWNSTFNILDEIEYITDRNLNLLKYINQYIFKKIKIENKNNKNKTKNNVSLEWKNKYHNLCSHIFDNLIISLECIDNYFKKHIVSMDENSIYVIAVDFINNIILEIPHMLDVYSLLNFNENNIYHFISIIFRIYTNPHFKTIINNILDNKYIYLVKYMDFKNVWISIINYLEKTPDIFNNLIEKLVQSNFKYQELGLEFIECIADENIKLFDEFEKKSNSFEELTEEFGDPITNELIREPLMLPLTNQFIDKSVIYQILCNKPINPFSGLPLTIKELEKYNSQKEIVEKLNKFKMDLQNAKNKLCFLP